MSNAPSHRRFYWPLQIAGWALYGSTGLASVAMFPGAANVQTAKLAIIAYTGALFLLAATHALRARASAAGWTSLSFGKLAARLLGATLLIAAASQIFISLLMIWPLEIITPENPYSFRVLVLYIFQTQIILLLWSLIYFSFHAIRNHKFAEVERWRLQAAVTNAELVALKAQINPHFIFNCLNNIRSLVIEDADKARDAITGLSELLRYSLQFSHEETVPLSREIEIAQDYLALESIHLERRLRFEFDIDPSTQDLPVPPMSVQLLVENAIKHGIAQLPAGGEIRVRSQRRGAEVEIEITNTGSLDQRAATGMGIGLRNAEERLRLLCGPSARLELRESAPGLVSAKLIIPAAQPAAQLA